MSTPPVADRRPQERTHHDDTVVDHYEWLRDKDDADTIALLEAENAYAEEQTAHLAGLREDIFEEIRSRTLETDLSVPVRDGDWWYYVRTREGSQYAIRCRVRARADEWTPPSADGALPGEQILLDSNIEAAGHDFFSLGAFSISDDGNLLAYSVDTSGDERYTIRIKDLSTGELLGDEITGASTGATWSADASCLFYTTVDEAWRPNRIWRHDLGSTGKDTLVHEENDERFFTGIGRTASQAYLVIVSASKVTSETRVLSADDPHGEFTVVLERIDGVEHSLEHVRLGDRDAFVVLHNATSENFELGWAPVADHLDLADLNVVVAGSPTRRLEDLEPFAHHLGIAYREDALSKVGLITVGPDGFGELNSIDVGEELYASGFGANSSWDPPYVRIGVTSFVTPATVYDVDLATGELTLRRQQPVLGGYDPQRYTQSRSWARADDGTSIPVSIVCRADAPRDGSAPALLYGYGSYEASIDPGFSIARLSLLDRGFVFAIAHVRGGGEMGRSWYENGKMLSKRNTFTDFIACARQLCDEKWTSADRLVAEGGSAGGLLMGAVANLAPEAFCGILAAVPFVDPLTSILDPALPLTVIEWDEWGNPLEDPEVYAYMKGYSPYENVGTHAYPAILAVTSLNDTRVLYVEPAKWVSRLRAEAKLDKPVLLKTEMAAGHGGVSGRYSSWRERAWELAWIIDTATHSNGVGSPEPTRTTSA